MARQYAYRIVLLYYSGKREEHYIHADDRMDAFEKAHRYCNPFDLHDGVQFIEPYRITKQYIAEHNVKFED